MNETTPTPPQPKTFRQFVYEFWEKVDWSKTNVDLAADLEVSYITVAKWRDIITGKTQVLTSRKYRVEWDAVDWAKNDSTLSKELHIPYAEVRRARIKLNKPYPSKDSYQRKVDPDKLATVDWQYTRDVDIGHYLGVSRERVRQIRNDTQKPACLVAGLGPSRIECMKWIVKNWETLKGKSRREISDLFEKDYPSLMTRPEVYNTIARSKIPTRLEREWKPMAEGMFEKINFNLPNIVLQMIYGVHGNSIATARDRLFKGKSGWHLGGYSKLVFDEKFIAELEAEKAKAVSLGFTVDSKRIDNWLQWKRDYKHPHTNKKK